MLELACVAMFSPLFSIQHAGAGAGRAASIQRMSRAMLVDGQPLPPAGATKNAAAAISPGEGRWRSAAASVAGAQG